ncbi:hypothetical protein GCM10027341_39090 [Spirosoma knui]
MHSIWFTIATAAWCIVGLVLLIRSVTSLIGAYTSGIRIEQSALAATFRFDLPEPGVYEVAIKRASVFGAIPRNNSFQINELANNQSIAVDNYAFLTSKRTDMSGHRIVPVAEFAIEQPGSFQFTNPATAKFTQTDKLLIGPKAGLKGVLLILATVFTGILFISGFVFFLLSLINR